MVIKTNRIDKTEFKKKLKNQRPPAEMARSLPGAILIPQALLVVADLAFLKTVSETKKRAANATLYIYGSPSGVRTRVTGVRGRRPRPLDDGTILTI